METTMNYSPHFGCRYFRGPSLKRGKQVSARGKWSAVALCTNDVTNCDLNLLKGQTIRNLIGVGGGESICKKKYLRKGKLNGLIHAPQLTLKHTHAMAWKKIHTRNLMKKKIPAPRKLPTSPRSLFTFFNGPSRRVLYAKVTFANKLSSSLKIFVDKRNKIQLG